MNDTPVRTRRKFDNTFKREAVQNWLQSGRSAEIIADELGISANLLYLWKKAFAPDAVVRKASSTPKPSPNSQSVADLQAQLDAARREIRRIGEQRDILKKTLGILSEPPSNGSNGSMR